MPVPNADTVVEIPLAALDPTDQRFRFRLSLTGLDELARDLAEHGQDFPVIVRPHPSSPDCLQLICGFRRSEALRRLDHTTVRAVIRPLDDDEALRLAWSENEARRSYTDLDRAHAVLKASQDGWSLRELQDLFSLKKSQLQRLSTLSTCPQLLKDAIASGDLSTTHAIVLSDLNRRYPDMDLSFWLDETLIHSLSVRALRRRVGAAHDEPTIPLITVTPDHLDFSRRRLTLASLSPTERATLITELESALAALRSP